jgi:outer membrane receptor protein involved in Fe transport
VKISRISRFKTGVAPLVLGVALIAAPAMAQTTTAEEEAERAAAAAADAAAATNVNEDGEIVVTGSRIRLPNLISQEPIVSVAAQYIEDRGLTNVADALNEIPGFRGSVTPAGSQGSFGQGVNFINTYGLGSNRNLTLLNGRRVVSSNVTTIFGNASPGTQVDLNTIPTILVDRIDRVSIGGAPVYGTDAIAGVVNIILKEKFEGVEVRATTGLTDRGDNFRYNLSGAAGFSFGDGRGNLTIAVSYDKVDGVLGNSRDFYTANLGSLTNPCSTFAAGQPCTSAASANLVTNLGFANRTPGNDGRINPNIGFNNSTTDGVPGSVLVRNVTIPGLSRGGVISNGGGAYNFQFARSGDLVAYNRGIPFVAALPNGAARASGGDGFTFNDYIQLTSNLERINSNLFFNYELFDGIKFFAEGMFFQGKGDELVQQPTFNATLFGGVSGPLTFRVDNPFLTTQARNQLTTLGYTTTFQMSRANADLADLTGSSRNRLYRGVAGFEGDFQVAGRDYNFEAYVNYGRNDFTDYGQNINQQRFVNAVNVGTGTGGQIICSTTPTVTGTGGTPVADPNCVPLNLFGEGAPSRAAISYILQNTVTKTRLEQFVANVNVGGSPFDLFGNPVAFNAGFEHHTEKGVFTPDPFLQAGLGRSVAIAPTSGKYELNEVFGEVFVPIITPDNNFIFSHLEVYGRVRRVDNSVNGGFTSWAAGGSFAPIRDIQFRGNFTRSFRAPSIVELYAPRTNVFTNVPDLCSPANINAGPVPTTRAANCAAFLARFPNATPLAAASATIPGLSGGNPNLRNEVADSFTYGVILQPRFLPGFSLSVDYINIKIADPISSLTVPQIAQGCFDNPVFDASDPANANGFCSLIRRDASGQVPADAANPAVTSGYVNGQQIKLDAVQATIDYTTQLDGIGLPGRIDIGGDLFYLRNRLVDITGIAPTQSEGLLGDPKWQGQARIRYVQDAFGMSANVNYTGEQALSYTNRGPNPNDTREFDHFDAYATVDAAIWYNLDKDFRVTLSVTNLFDRIGQEYYGYIHPSSINDALGRRYALTVRKAF